jgi:tetratricopeptide (TPR) repeat protein
MASAKSTAGLPITNERPPKLAGWLVVRRTWAEMTRSRSAAGHVLAYVVGDLEDGTAFIDQALVLNPNLAWAWLFSSWTKIWLGETEVAIERATRAMRLSPHDPSTFDMENAIADAHFIAGRYAEALSWAKRR